MVRYIIGGVHPHLQQLLQHSDESLETPASVKRLVTAGVYRTFGKSGKKCRINFFQEAMNTCQLEHKHILTHSLVLVLMGINSPQFSQVRISANFPRSINFVFIHLIEFLVNFIL